MSNVQPRGRRAYAAVTAAVMVGAMALVLAPAANAAPSTNRLWGQTRYSTAVDVADEFGAATHVIVASGENFPDAMTAAGYAGAVDAPILLTQPNTLTSATDAKLRALPNPAVTVAGGTGAVSAAVFAAIDAATTGSVTRVWGQTRYETACEMANAIGSGNIGSVSGKKTAVVATGLNYPDALAAGVLAAEKNLPVYLVSSTVPACVTASLTSNGIQQVIIAGETGVVSASVETQLETTTGGPAIRYGGANRYGTAAEIADGAISSAFGFDAQDVLLAYGRNFPDALAAGPYGALVNAPILLTSSLPAESSAWLRANAATLDLGTITAIGGTGVIDAATLAAAVAAATPGTPATNATLTSTPASTQVLEYDQSGPTGIKATTVTFSGLDDTKEYDVSFFPVNWGGGYEDSVSKQSNGHWMFRDQDQFFNGLPDDDCNTYEGGAEIVSINGQPVGSACDYDVLPEGGRLEVRVDNSDSTYNNDAGYLVVWLDTTGKTDDTLDLDGADKPTEAFGVAGPIVWHGGEAPTGDTDLNGEYVVYVNEDENYIVSGDDWLYRYDSGDRFGYDFDYELTLSSFETYLNNGDYLYNEDVAGNTAPYNRSLSNWFQLDDDYTATPASVVATTGDFDDSSTDVSKNDVRITWTHSPTDANMSEDADEDADYCVNRFDVSNTGVYSNNTSIGCWGWGDDTTFSNNVMNNKSVTVNDQPVGDYAYTVYADSAANDSGDYSDPSNKVTPEAATPVSVPADAPDSTSATVQDKDSDGKISTGDVLAVTFDELMAAVNVGDQFSVTDSDTTVADIINGTNSTWVLNGAGNMITITMTAGPNITTVGSPIGAQYPAVVTASSGVTDTTAAEWDLAGSTDKTF